MAACCGEINYILCIIIKLNYIKISMKKKIILTIIAVLIILNSNLLKISFSYSYVYYLTVLISPAGAGTVTVGIKDRIYNINKSTGFMITPGDKVTLTATAKAGYELKYWGDEKTNVFGFRECGIVPCARCAPPRLPYNPCAITMDTNRTAVAYFKKAVYTVSTGVNPSDTGRIQLSTSPSGSPYTTSGSVTYDAGTNINLTAVPASSAYSFSGWSYTTSGSPGSAGTANPLYFAVSGNLSMVANFRSMAATPSAPQNAKIQPIDHGFSITWSAPISDGGKPPISYKIYKSADPLFVSSITIQTTDMKNGKLFFNDNRIQDPSAVTSENPLYYKVVAVNTLGEGPGMIVNTKGLGSIQYGVDTTIKGSGFIKDSSITVALVAPGERYDCGKFDYIDSNTVKGKCNITETPTGTFDVEVTMVAGGKTLKATLYSGFQVTYPKPTAASVDVKSEISDGKLTINSVQGDNLYTGAFVKIAVVSNGTKLAEKNCFNLSSFDYTNNNFPGGGSCDISDLLKTAGGDLAKIKIFIANDEGSIPVEVTIPTLLTCASVTWTPDSSTICPGTSFTQTSNCGTSRTAQGTKTITWTPDPSIKCGSFTQTSNCNTTQSATGGLTCGSGQTCYNNACCTPKTKTAACGTKCSGSASDGCGSNITCDSSVCSSPDTCGGGGVVGQCGCTQTTWTPDVTNICGSITQTTVQCGGATRTVIGNKTCSSSQTCYNNSCCAPATCSANNWECGKHNNNCGGEIDCGGCSGLLDFCNSSGKCRPFGI